MRYYLDKSIEDTLVLLQLRALLRKLGVKSARDMLHD